MIVGDIPRSVGRRSRYQGAGHYVKLEVRTIVGLRSVVRTYQSSDRLEYSCVDMGQVLSFPPEQAARHVYVRNRQWPEAWWALQQAP